MTREEALEKIKAEIRMYEEESLESVEWEECYEALNDTVSRGVLEQVMWERDIAIEQLRKLGYELGQKIEPCEDCISKQAVDTLVDELARAISDERCGISRGRSTATIMRDIRHLPPVTPQKYGKWILTIEDWNKWTCSKCGYVKRTDIHVNIGWKFCPNCGAKMQESEEA